MIRSRTLRPGLLTVLAVITALAATTGPALQAAGAEQKHTFATDRLTVRNVIGEIHIEGHSGSDFEVVVTTGGRDAGQDAIRTKVAQDQLDVVFPAGDGEFVYPRLGQSRSDFNIRKGGKMGELFYGQTGTERIKVHGSGNGREMWADLTIMVPAGGRLDVEHGIGELVAKNVDGTLELSTQAGNVTADGTYGELSVATGSGDVNLTRFEGENVEIATGSGTIKVQDSRGDDVELATGSGEVYLSALQAQSIEVGTGSGDITARQVDAVDIEMGTGSGDVTLDLAQMGHGEYEIGTGSGDIELTVAGGVSADIHAETSGGSIVVDVGNAEFSKRSDEEVRLTVGSGDARVDLGSGSGDITIRG